MAEGVVSAGQFGSTVRGLVGQMIPFAQGNKTATLILSNLAHEAGGPVTSSLRQLADWTGVKGKAAADQFSQGMNKASQEMSQHVRRRPEPVGRRVLAVEHGDGSGHPECDPDRAADPGVCG